MPFPLPEHALQERFLAASGPGGQNVNKVATAVQIKMNIYKLRLPPYAFKKLKEIAGNKINMQGELVLTCREYRTREANRAEARSRLSSLLEQAHQRNERRIKTKPSRSAKKKRVDRKKQKSQVKKMRSKPTFD